MWNRVFLLASGFLFGWSLVRYWTVPRAELRTHELRLGLGLAIGVVVIVLLGLESLPAALAGTGVYAFSALVAYAGNARQVGRQEQALPSPRPTPAEDAPPRRGVVLVSCLEPPTYDGPSYWAWRLRRRDAQGQPAPHWFARPRAYVRIRRAYEARAQRAGPADALQGLGQALGAALGADYVVETARVGVPDALSRTLADIVRQGATRVVVQPLEVFPDALDAVRQAVTDARVREAGVRVTVAEPFPVPLWECTEERLDAWMSGRPAEPPPIPPSNLVARLQHAVAPER